MTNNLSRWDVVSVLLLFFFMSQVIESLLSGVIKFAKMVT